MPKDPAFLFYYQDFLVGTDSFSNTQVGAYIRCLCHQAHAGFITKKHMMKVLRTKQNWDIVSQKFISENGTDNYYNKRLREEMEKRANYIESRRDNRSRPNF